jgi:hypothetical protein
MAVKIESGRLAFRVEGEFWNCYYAASNSMEGAIFMGSILMILVQDNEANKRRFMGLMKSCLEYMMKTIGVDLEGWSRLREAPEHERTKE